MSDSNQIEGHKKQETTSEHILHNFGPVKTIKDDILYREELVDALCDLITKSDVSESFTIGISGKWGSGKTSFINFVKERIGDGVDIVDFNPWIFTTQKDISNQFLELLSYHLSSRLSKWFNSHRRKISKITGNIANIDSDPTTSRLLNSFSKLLMGDECGIPLNDVKKSISLRMSKRKEKIVVFIDDLDRLDKEEIRMTMKLVRSIADFPNIIYVLCYDSEIVEQALDTDFYDGHHYLQKIINIPISLPEFNHTTSINLLADCFLNVTGKRTWSDYERSVINEFTHSLSLREVHLISTKFRILFNVSNNNTCPIDLLALQYIEIKSPQTFNWISENRGKLCGMGLLSASMLLSQNKRVVIDDYKDDKQDQSFVKLLSILFPLFEHSSSNDYSNEQYRISNYRYINNYFLLTPSSLIINDEDLESFIKYSPDELYEYINSNNQNIVVEMIYRVCKKIELNPNYCEDNMRLAEICLEQPFSGDKYINVNYSRYIGLIVDQYLKNISILNDKLTFLQSKCPNNIHRLISYGFTIDFVYLCDNEDISIKKPIYDLVCNRLIHDSRLKDITDPVEFMVLIILIHRSDDELAKNTFLELMPSYDSRCKFYDSLIEQNYGDVNFFRKLVNDPPV